MEADKQEGQKTIISFITGLLIGGLLVWVFSSSPENPQKVEEIDEVTDTSIASSTTDNVDENSAIPKETTPSKSETVKKPAEEPKKSTTQKPSTGKGSLSVKSQPAGAVVVLSETTFPTDNGWIAVRDFDGTTGGRILGAARYAIKDGLVPSSVNLLRSTEAGKTYQVVFFNENGDKVFDTKDDSIIDSGSVTFKAE